MTDMEAIKASVRIEEVIGRTVKLTRRGSEYLGLCPFHDEKTPSFTVYRGNRFHCFGCGEKGDVIDFVQKTRHCTVAEALEYLGVERASAKDADRGVTDGDKGAAKTARAVYVSCAPPPDAPPAPLPPDATIYPYMDAQGRVVSYVVRTEATETHKKTFRGLSWGRTGIGAYGWVWKHPNAPRPLYGLQILFERHDAPVMVCEGEKAADAAARLFPDFVAVTWPGGSSAVKNADWSPLVGREIVIWPDADEPGMKAATEILEKLPQSRVIDISGLPQGFDAADLDAENPKEWLNNRLIRDDESAEYVNHEEYVNHGPPNDGEPEEDEPRGIGVIPLGYIKDTFYYFSQSKRVVTELRPAEHTRANLSGMASAAKYWEVEFQQFWSKQGFSWVQLADYLMELCRQRGQFDPHFIRGRGAWMEGKTPVLHIGDALIVNGRRRSLQYPGSPYIYESDLSLLKDISAPLATKDAHWLMKICKLLRWETPANGTLLAGWIVLAPICGALEWRPSIWITGGSGAGKSWVMDRIVNVCLSKIGLYVAFNTTEPGIRQELQSDARPVIFDEAERDSKSSAFRMEEILGYQRVASSENSVQILKGDASGIKAKSYKPRSCFLFQSINTGITKRSDESRVTVLSLRDHSRPGDIPFEDLEAVTYERITPEFASGLISRSVSLLPVIRANALTFAKAVAEHLKSRRYGDQIGALLAGAYSLHSSDLITYEKAIEIVSREEWSEQSPQEDEKDEFKLLRLLLAARLKIGTAEMPVSRLIEASQLFQSQDGLPAPELAQRVISENGIKFGAHENVSGIFFSTNHPGLKRILRGTEWEASWTRSLNRIQGSVGSKEIVVRFALGHRSRATFIPLSIIDPR